MRVVSSVKFSMDLEIHLTYWRIQFYRNRVEFGQDEGKMGNLSLQNISNLPLERLTRHKYPDLVIEVSLRPKGQQVVFMPL